MRFTDLLIEKVLNMGFKSGVQKYDLRLDFKNLIEYDYEQRKKD